VIITRDLVRYAKPDPDLFLAAAEKLDVDIGTACVVGDAIWDMLAARAHAPWASAFFPAATARRNSNAPAPTAFMKTLPTCWRISTRWAGGASLFLSRERSRHEDHRSRPRRPRRARGQGQTIRITTPKGAQAADFFAYNAASPAEWLSANHTWVTTFNVKPRRATCCSPASGGRC
jgi:uncharacterized protein YcgI (DUF1989 family)